MAWLWFYLGVMSFAAFAAFGIDKRLAIRRARRISERALLLLCAVGGSAGGLVGMYLFHHKTRKRKFYLTVPLLLVLQIAVVYVVCAWGK